MGLTKHESEDLDGHTLSHFSRYLHASCHGHSTLQCRLGRYVVRSCLRAIVIWRVRYLSGTVRLAGPV